jgi:hypothetical protein
LPRYSQLYVERGRPAPDNERARFRLYAKFDDMISIQGRRGVEHLIRTELGVKLAQAINEDLDYYADFETFFTQCEIRDLLDSITLIYNYMKDDTSPS